MVSTSTRGGSALDAGARSRRRRRARHAHVHQHDVGGRDRQRLERLAAVGRLADDAHVGLGVDHELQPGAHERLVVDEEDADHAGIAARTSKPPSGRGPASSVPPRGSTRSRIPVSPRPRPSLGALPAPSSRDDHGHLVGLPAQQHGRGRAGPGVLEHVGQRLLGDAVDGQAGGGRERARLALLRRARPAARPSRVRATSAGSSPRAGLGLQRRVLGGPSARRISACASRAVAAIVCSAAAAAAPGRSGRRRPARSRPTASARPRRAARGRSARARRRRRARPAARAGRAGRGGGRRASRRARRAATSTSQVSGLLSELKSSKRSGERDRAGERDGEADRGEPARRVGDERVERDQRGDVRGQELVDEQQLERRTRPSRRRTPRRARGGGPRAARSAGPR